MSELQLKHRFDEVVRASGVKISEELYRKASQVITEIEKRYNKQGKMTQADGEAIYGWRYSQDGDHWYGLVPDLLDEDEFREMACLCFRDPTWLARLLDSSQGAEHIHNINQLIGRRVDRLLIETDRQKVDILDLGAGTLGTLTAVINSVLYAGRRLNCLAIDLTPELVIEAKRRAKELEAKHGDALTVNVLPASDMVGFLETCEPASFDVITASFSIHHLHPRQQIILVQQVFVCLKLGGAFLLADPQEGKSPFNLEQLIIKEPEGVFAAFAPPDDMLMLMADSGFVCEEPLYLDNENYMAYAVAGFKV